MRRFLVLVLNLLAVAYLLWQYPEAQGDFAVYRVGGEILANGGSLYAGPVWGDLLFTYTPFAALTFTPFTVIPYAPGSLLFTVLTYLALAAVLLVVLRRPSRVAVVLPLTLLLEPVRATLGFGQINILLLLLVVLDCLVDSPRWPRGLLVGIAAAIKLTPLVFLVFFLVKRDRRAAVVTLVTFASCAVLGWLFAPASSLDFWTRAVFDTNRIGSLAFFGNESLRGMLAKVAVIPPAVQFLLWALGSVVVLYLAVRGIRRAGTGQALVLCALAGLLISPISWSHHWVWLVPAVLLLADRRLALTGVVLMALCSIDPVGGLVLAVGGYFWFALAVLVKAARPAVPDARPTELSPAGRRPSPQPA
ncbi:glycosyltransferase 87 family protein [Kutzneria albida]|uniref:Alpha-1,2-mannosyltransferase n=1 Tax=Kutzneria albida DSM 43870 TaxID=1449976 RepID=W5W085_9PSEU|nr:glycosyltransferase 87 family protein [Kutzneria albida]AHH93976.1 hypothetical protein KALB_600 [Kutzneria albida DSM 43870]